VIHPIKVTMTQYHYILILVVATQLVDGFTILHQSIKYRNIQTYPIRRKTTYNEQILSSLFAGVDDDSNSNIDEDLAEVQDNFDGKGFAGYLAPYAVALVGSIAVTAAFVKFVLLDY